MVDVLRVKQTGPEVTKCDAGIFNVVVIEALFAQMDMEHLLIQ